jgi:hypothetical protein
MRETWKVWGPGDHITVNRIVWDQREVENVLDVFQLDWFGPRTYAEMAETFLGRLHDGFAQLLNSGSSALFLGTLALQ